jgi:hypothetical protein
VTVGFVVSIASRCASNTVRRGDLASADGAVAYVGSVVRSSSGWTVVKSPMLMPEPLAMRYAI